MAKETNPIVKDYQIDTTTMDRPYDNMLNRSETTDADAVAVNPTDTTGNDGTDSGSTGSVGSNSDVNGSVQNSAVKSDGALSDVYISTFIRSPNWSPKTRGFTINGNTGYAEFSNVYVSGNIQALTGTIGGWVINGTSLTDLSGTVGLSSAVTAGDDIRFWAGNIDPALAPFSVTESGVLKAQSGTIGGFTITATSLYGGIIKTALNVAAGQTGVIMDTAGLRGYDAVLGNTFNLPTNGSAPTFASGIINSTIFNVNTNAIIRTSATVGDGTVNSAGILINNTGLYGCAASQTPSTANLKALVDGTISIAGTITATAGKIGSAANYWSIGANGITATAGSGDVIINYGKTDFGQDSTAGFILGYDYSVLKPKFEIGSSVSKLFKYDGTDFSLIGGTITGGTIQTVATGQRILLSGANNNLTFYNAADVQVVQMGGGTFSSNAIRINTDSSTTDGVKILSNQAGTGFFYDNSSNNHNQGLYINQSSTGSNNDMACIQLANSGTYYAQTINSSNTCGGMLITQSGTKNAIVINNDSTGQSIQINHNGSNRAIELYSNNAGGSPAIYIVSNSASAPGMHFIKNNSGEAFKLEVSAANSGTCYGIVTNIVNTGSGSECLFDLQGSEFIAADANGTVNYVIRVRVDGVIRYIRLHNATGS